MPFSTEAERILREIREETSLDHAQAAWKHLRDDIRRRFFGQDERRQQLDDEFESDAFKDELNLAIRANIGIVPMTQPAEAPPSLNPRGRAGAAATPQGMDNPRAGNSQVPAELATAPSPYDAGPAAPVDPLVNPATQPMRFLPMDPENAMAGDSEFTTAQGESNGETMANAPRDPMEGAEKIAGAGKAQAAEKAAGNVPDGKTKNGTEPESAKNKKG